MKEFVIDFLYNAVPYIGLVTPKEDRDGSFYSVHLESENQEVHLDILANACEPDKSDWCIKYPEGQEPPQHYDKAFLQEIGEAIEKCEP